MELSVLNIKGEDTGKKIALSESVFGINPHNHAMYLDVKRHLANKRQGTHKSKERSEITGSTRKLRKQKGSGAARVGSIKSPIFRGGGRVFGPKNRDYSFKLNKNIKRLARRSAFSFQTCNNNVLLLEKFTFEKPKTKRFLGILDALKLNEEKTLFILKESNNYIHLSARNLANVSVLIATELTTYSILNAKKIIILEDALGLIEENLTK